MSDQAIRGLRSPQGNGFTLVEVFVALALFALIGVAGFSMLSGVLQTQDRTEDRLQRLSEIQRAVFVLAADLDQASGRLDGAADHVTFQKTDLSGRPAVVRYDLRGERLFRTVSGPFGERTQPILSDVQTLTWSYRQAGLSWADRTPTPVAAQPAIQTPGAVSPPVPPPPPIAAIAIDLRLAGPDGRSTMLRRVFRTPEAAL